MFGSVLFQCIPVSSAAFAWIGQEVDGFVNEWRLCLANRTERSRRRIYARAEAASAAAARTQQFLRLLPESIGYRGVLGRSP